ncbi:MFS transporter [Pigmentiphaga kullae]|uniref:Sugar phosphate permease n=1 Tax=Pigmentiphaga kullae TaxID=151784 RepID=A0A4Q7N847_9BURK|nr:MFS transporter [Pigmentiphaga kullae]RZS78157.1 sugar phosphate permease [Pigmentiphaga kullae]
MKPDPRQPSTAWVLAVTLAIQSLASAATIAPAVVAPVATRELGLPSSAIGFYMALVYLGAMFTSVIGGTLVTRLGAVRCSQAALLLCGLGMGLLCSGGPALAAVGALVIGAGYGPITPSSSYLLMRSTPAHRMSLVFSIKQTGVPLGGVLAALASPQIEHVLGWRWALGVCAVACLLCMLVAQSVRRSLDVPGEPAAPWRWQDLARPVGLVWRTPALRLMAVCSLLFSFIQLAITAYLVTYLNLSLGWTLIAAGVILSLSQVAGVAGRILWGIVADRWAPPRKVLGGLALTMAASCVATAFLQPATPWILVAAVAAVFGASAIGWNGVFLAEVARRAPAGQAGAATGGTLLFTYFGVLAGQPLFSYVASLAGQAGQPGYAWAYGLLVIPALFCATWLLRARS